MERGNRGVRVAEWRPMGQRAHGLNPQEPGWIGRTNGVAIGRVWRVRTFCARKLEVSFTHFTLGGPERHTSACPDIHPSHIRTKDNGFISTSYWRIKRKSPGRAELVRVPDGRHQTNRKFPRHHPHPTLLYIPGSRLVPYWYQLRNIES